jgi:hypothetical protein
VFALSAMFITWPLNHIQVTCNIMLQYNAVVMTADVHSQLTNHSSSHPHSPNRAGVLRGVAGVPGSRTPGVTISVLKQHKQLPPDQMLISTLLTTTLCYTHTSITPLKTAKTAVTQMPFQNKVFSTFGVCFSGTTAFSTVTHILQPHKESSLNSNNCIQSQSQV